MMGLNDLVCEADYTEDGYAPIVDYGAWRVAILNYHQELLPENIARMHCHDETDEVFVLLQGQCTLYIGDPCSVPDSADPASAGVNGITAVHCVPMVPHRAYTVRCGVWHSHTVSRDGKVLIVENRDTDDRNSRELHLTEEQRSLIRAGR